MEREERKIRRRVGLLLLSFALFLSSTWVVIDEILAPLEEEGTVVTVPACEGIRLEELKTDPWLEREVEYRYDPNVPAGVILSQSPQAGSTRKLSGERPTCTLTLTVSLGCETATVPALIGTDVRKAQLLLRQMGFAVRTEISSGAFPEGEVYEVLPREGTVIPVGSEILLYASAGTPAVTVRVPDLCGLSRADAITQIWLSQLAVAEIVEVESRGASGVVIRQNYPPDTVVLAGTALTVYVGKNE